MRQLGQLVSKNPAGTASLRFWEFTYLFVTEFAGKLGKCLPQCHAKKRGPAAVGSALFLREKRSMESGWEHVATGNVSFYMNHLMYPQQLVLGIDTLTHSFPTRTRPATKIPGSGEAAQPK